MFNLTDTELNLCEQHLDLLVKWNKVYNLTAIRDRNEMAIKHLNDSLSVLPHLPNQTEFNMLDVGTGGGFPGIPLAIAKPNWQFTLVDCSLKKVRFLKQVCTELGLENVTPIHTRIEELHPEVKFDGIISRAFASINKMVELTAHTLKDSGHFYAMKGPEVENISEHIHIKGKTPLEVPRLQGERYLYTLGLY